MSREMINKYRLDLTGKNASNLILAQPIDLDPAPKNRIAIPTYGPFYTEGLVVRERTTGRVLEPLTHYMAVNLHEEATLVSGLECCTFIVVTDPEVLAEIEIDYQIVGGSFIIPVDSILKLIEDLDLDERPVNWADIYGRPTEYNPTKHLHDAGDLYGFEYVTAALERIRDAILIGDEAAHQEILDYVDKQDTLLSDRITALSIAFDTHRTDYTNPHQVTKEQVGLGLVENYAVASAEAAIEGVSDELYMTPLKVLEAIYNQALMPLEDHTEDKENPHEVTKEQTGLGLVENFQLATEAEAINAEVHNRYLTPWLVGRLFNVKAEQPLQNHLGDLGNPHKVSKFQVGLGDVANYTVATLDEATEGVVKEAYMTPWLVKRAIDVQAAALLNQHVSDLGNPHRVTKAQVELGNVFNYGIATFTEATEGLVSNKYMTPLRVKDYVTLAAIAPLENHIGNLDNPHQVNKNQVGLGYVENFGISNKAEAIAGTSNSKYITPLRLMESLTENVINPLEGHMSSYHNPHQVTKEQVGLGNVANYLIASKAMAIAGTVNNRYMTPLRVKEAILEFAPAEDLSDILRRLAELEAIINGGKTTSSTWTTNWNVTRSSSWTTNWTSTWQTSRDFVTRWDSVRQTSSGWTETVNHSRTTERSWTTMVLVSYTTSQSFTTRWNTTKTWTTRWWYINTGSGYGGQATYSTVHLSTNTSSSWQVSRITETTWSGTTQTGRTTSSSWTTRWSSQIVHGTSWSTTVSNSATTTTTWTASQSKSRTTSSSWQHSTSRVTTRTWTTAWT